jgi:hypothetical protein
MGAPSASICSISPIWWRRQPGARRRLRRRGAARLSRAFQAGRRPRHRALPGGGECLRRRRPQRDPGRCGYRSRRLSLRRLRLCHPLPDAPGDPRSQGRAGPARAHRAPRHRLLPQFRPLAHALASADPGHHAGDASLPAPGTRRPISISARSAISCSSAPWPGIAIEQAIAIDSLGRASPIRSYRWANLCGEQGLFLLRRD